MRTGTPGRRTASRRGEERFDSFYHATRHSLLVQSYALTGDPAAAHTGVRDAYTAAWRHWGKVSGLDDPSDWVRARAWRLAQRRHGSRRRRSRGEIATPHSAVLTALEKLPGDQRRVLLLTRLAGLSLPHAAAEMGLSTDAAGRLRERATTTLAASLEVEPGAIRGRLLSLADPATRSRLPRASAIRRAGSRRRTSHTLVAALAVAAVAVTSGAFAYQEPDEVAPRRASTPPPRVSEPAPVDRPAPILDADDLLDRDQAARLGPGQRWRTVRTDDNTGGDGINTTCQQERFADPGGVATLVREFKARGAPARSAVQTVEVSESVRQARKAFETTLGWYAGCQVARFQLLTAYRVGDIGDEAQLLTARVWSRPVTSYSVAVARTGRVVTSTLGESVGVRSARPAQLAQSLDDAVSLLCSGAGSDDCTHEPSFTAVPPPPSGEEPGVLAVADLPPVGRISRPWVGTDARPAPVNPALTTCDRADFSRAGVRTRTRSFLIPRAKVPRRFGLTETYGEFPSPDAARQFLRQVQARITRCEDRNEAATVSATRTVPLTRAGSESVLWDVVTEISDDESVRFRIGFVRVRDTVAQVTFSPARRDDIAPRQFDALVTRAGDRLGELD